MHHHPAIGRVPIQVLRVATSSLWLAPADIIGEMALFEGGSRMADCLGLKEGVIGVIAFSELDHMFSTEARLAEKLTRVFASAMLSRSKLMRPVSQLVR